MVEEVQIDDLAAPKQDARIEEEDKDDDDDVDDAITVTPKVKQPPVEEDTVAAGEAERNVDVVQNEKKNGGKRELGPSKTV